MGRAQRAHAGDLSLPALSARRPDLHGARGLQVGQAQPNIHSEAERHTTTHHSPLWQGQGVRQADARRQVLARELQAPLVLRSEHVDGGPSLGRRATHAFARQAQRNGRILWPTAIGGTAARDSRHWHVARRDQWPSLRPRRQGPKLRRATPTFPPPSAGMPFLPAQRKPWLLSPGMPSAPERVVLALRRQGISLH